MIVYPQICYDNLLRSASSVVVAGGEQTGFEAIYAYDWRDFTTYRPAASSTGTYTSTITATITKTCIVSAIVIWIESGAASTSRVTVEAEATPGGGYVYSTSFTGPGKGWTNGPVTPDSNVVSGWSVQAGCAVRVKFDGFNGSSGVRQVTVGPSFCTETGQWGGVMPPSLNGGFVTETVISMNGSLLARNVRRVEKSMTINLNKLSQAWIRNTWEPFTSQAIRYPFWYRWNPITYPTDIAFAAADDINLPKNDVNALMSVAMPIKVVG